MRVEHTVVVPAGMAVSVFLHLAAVVWWFSHSVVAPVALGASVVTVDLVTPNPVPIVQPVTPPPSPVQQPEPEVLKDDEMAVQRKMVKKKLKPKTVAQPPVMQPQPVQQQAASPAAAAQTQQNSMTEARFDANYLSAPATYPSLSQRLGEEGRVLLRVDVSADGRPLTVALKMSSGFVRLDEAAIKAVARWQFKPARQNGRAVASKVDVPILFKLKKTR